MTDDPIQTDADRQRADASVFGAVAASEGELVERRRLDYRHCRFTLRVQLVERELFMPQVIYESGLAGIEQTALPSDCDPYRTDAEAWRHAEQQAIRWVNDRTGDGRGQF